MEQNNHVPVDLSRYTTGTYTPGAGWLVRTAWYLTNILFIKSYWCPSSRWKRFLLKLFGAKIGKGVVIKPGVNVKYPWRLVVGDHAWIGEQVWIDNLEMVHIGSHVCISQGAMLLCGNHDYTRSSFDLMTGEIKIGDGAWIGARSMLGPGVSVATHAVLSVQSVATSNLEAWTIYRGNPAVIVKKRTTRE